jgi:hypothetical protein
MNLHPVTKRLQQAFVAKAAAAAAAATATAAVPQ